VQVLGGVSGLLHSEIQIGPAVLPCRGPPSYWDGRGEHDDPGPVHRWSMGGCALVENTGSIPQAEPHARGRAKSQEKLRQRKRMPVSTVSKLLGHTSLTTTTTYLNTLRRELHRAVETREAASGKVANDWQSDAPQATSDASTPATTKPLNRKVVRKKGFEPFFPRFINSLMACDFWC
jgi:hypothetical protein